MLQEIHIEDTECRFRELVEKSVQGDEFVILKNNRAVAKIIPFQRKKHKRTLGTAKGQVIVKGNFKEIPEGFED
ncbi:MAG: type II toxin-antitoxin system Phd/YefM family antitoxin [Desulfococcaceae bacterium]